jgi:DNA-binding LacI/PurR family transcriptional regulator
MKALERSRLADTVAATIRDEIDRGRISEELPSCRDLAMGLGVSLPTVLVALQQLATEGLLVAGKPRRPYRLTVRPEHGPLSEKRLLILYPRWIGGLKSVTRDTVDRLHLKCAEEGWDVQIRILDYSNASRPGRRWDELLGKERPTRLVAVMGTPVLARWAKESGIQALFIGGSPGDSMVPSLGISLSACVRRLLPNLLNRGHRNFCLPICGYTELYVEALRGVCREALEDRGLTFVPAYHAPFRAQGGGEAIRAALRPVFATRPPSALIFTGLKDYLATMGMLHEYRLIPGKDVSITVLTHEDPLDWMDPQPGHFILPSNKLWQLVRNWLKAPAAPRFNAGAILLPATYMPESDTPSGGASSI